MATESFIPSVWSARMQRNLNDRHVYAARLNRDYEGEISAFGDSVRIHTVGRITINSYTKNSSSLTYENPTGNTVVLVIDQVNSYSFRIDFVDKAQQKPKLMDDFIREAAWGLSDTADADVATELASGVATANQLTAATSVGTGAGDQDAWELLVDLGVQLDINNVPREGRWAVVPPWYEGMLRKDARFSSFNTPNSAQTLRRGELGRDPVSGFDVFVSNNVPVSSLAFTVIAGVNSAAAFAEQILMDEPVKLIDDFGDGHRGLHLYGRRILDPTRLASVIATQAV